VIYVDAIRQLPSGHYDRVSGIVEMRGCWNKELMTAMEEQLKDRYLKNNPSPYGMYLVGWFTCPQMGFSRLSKERNSEVWLR